MNMLRLVSNQINKQRNILQKQVFRKTFTEPKQYGCQVFKIKLLTMISRYRNRNIYSY